ncbi:MULTISPECIES: FtsW/RodA/SpoVE family cell cycle protein [Arthrobacter]|uniref:FtsW/RodA/SpoVE family cell cycle protein n=2 Tax=Arthrobacter TaxID=1663 RepID=A0ABU9KKY8_9MICC|nr:FtsW/RodA/SpoVE family cell cycle protein [Arthrobacter sp. YJM1]MDP5226930.1 FtsW/RodA/SpoVE family cell cycle protein [Arthrobacter sp. YJM1]
MSTALTDSVVVKPRRNIELVLLVLALLVGIGASVLSSVNNPGSLNGSFWFQSSLLAVASLAMHITLRIRAQYADPFILPVAVALNGLGLAMIHRLDGSKGTAGDNQLRWTLIAVACTIVLIWVLRDHRRLRGFTYISLAVSAVLLVLPMVPGLTAGDINGAQLWIQIGPFTFQPAEIAKITLAIFFAGYLSVNRDLILLAGRKIGPLQLPRFRDMGPMLAAWAVSIGILVLQRDMGTSFMFFSLFMVMIYVATGRVSWVVIGLILIAVAGTVAAQLFTHVKFRMESWYDAFDPVIYNRDPGGSSQIVNGLFGMADGGIFGTGLGQGQPYLVPYANSDMIIASFGEELGLIGLAGMILLYLLLITRGFRAALGARDSFGKLMGVGLSFVMAVQCFVVIGGVTRLIPLTGLTTPFLAAGGSSLLANWIVVGLLLMISNTARGPVDTSPLHHGDDDSAGASAPPSGDTAPIRDTHVTQEVS